MSIKKTAAVLTVVFAAAFGSVAFALDPVTPNTPGFLTDFEAYLSGENSSEGDLGRTLSLCTGGGFTESFSYLLTADITKFRDKDMASAPGADDEFTSIDEIGLSFIINPVKTEDFSLTFMPGVFSCASRLSGQMAYPEMKIWNFGGNMELCFTSFSAFQPFINAGYYFLYDSTFEGENSWEVPLTLGFVHPVTDTVDFLAAFTSAAGKGYSWETTDRYLAAGFNFMLTDNLECLTEAGWNYTGNGFVWSAGLLYSL